MCGEAGSAERGQYSLVWGFCSLNLSPATKERVPRLCVSLPGCGVEGKEGGRGLNTVTVKHKKNNNNKIKQDQTHALLQTLGDRSHLGDEETGLTLCGSPVTAGLTLALQLQT